jgi:erythrin-vacuolar iron transport family protein
VKQLSELSERDVLALAIASEEEDSRIYQSFAEKCRTDFPASAKMFDEMADEERGHRDSLYGLFREKFGEHLPPIRREDVRGFVKRRQAWMQANIQPDAMRAEASLMEDQAASFYEKAAAQSLDVSVRALFANLAEVERGHEKRADALEKENITDAARTQEESAKHRLFVLQYVQPGLAGLIDGSVSTLAPIFAAAFATQSNHSTFLVGLAASIGAGISMGFTEALSDDGTITGRGSAINRGVVCGIMTTIGGLGHTIPFLVPDSWANAFHIALVVAIAVVVVELVAISWIRTHYMETPFWRAFVSVIVGGVLVLLAGIFIGSA